MAAPHVEVSPDGRSSTYHYGGGYETPSPTKSVDVALERTSKELDPYGAAVNLVTAWAEQQSELRPLLPEMIRDINEREERALSRHRKGKSLQPGNGAVLPRVGDIALIVTSIGPSFYRVVKVVVGSDGKVTGLALQDPNRPENVGQAVPVQRITGVFRNLLMEQS